MIYFDHAATSFYRPREVGEGMIEALHTMGSPGRGAHGCAHAAAGLLYDTRVLLSDFFHVGNPQRVVFTFNATESLNLVLQGCLKPGDHCITSELEHNSVLRPLYHLAQQGVAVEYVEGRGQGIPMWETLEQRIRPETRMVVVGHGSNVTGNIADLEAIGALCKKHTILFVVDAAQTAGLLPIDLQKAGIDALCLSGHKGLLGPQGVGVLCLSEKCTPLPLKFGGTGTNSFSLKMPDLLPETLEAGTMNVHGIAGLKKGLEYLKHMGLDEVYGKATHLAQTFLTGIRNLPGLHLYGDLEAKDRLPLVSLNLGNEDAGFVSDTLEDAYGIATRPGAHCAPGVHRYFGTERQGMVRFSFSHFNTLEEVEVAIQALWAIGRNRE